MNEQDTAISEIIRGTRDALGMSAGDITNQQAANRPNSTPARSRSTIYPKLQQIYQILIQPISDILPADPNASIVFIPINPCFYFSLSPYKMKQVNI